MEENWNQIEAYFKGDLNQQERKKLEEKMKTNKEFAQEVELYKDIEGAIRLNSNKVLKKQLNEIHDRVVDQKPQAKVRTLSTYRIGLIAASIALLLFAGYWFLNTGTTSTDELFAANYELYDWSTDTRGSETTSFQSLNDLYQNGEFQQFINEVNALNIDSNTDPELVMALGCAYLETGTYDKAISTFKHVETNAFIGEEAQFNIALSHLKSNDLAAARIIFLKLTRSNNNIIAKKSIDILSQF